MMTTPCKTPFSGKWPCRSATPIGFINKEKLMTPLKQSEDALQATGELPEPSGLSVDKLTLSELQIAHERVYRARLGGNVLRYHTWPIIGEQTNGHHTFNMVAMLLALHPNPSVGLIRAIMYHDTAEHEIGDVPSPGLRDYADLGRAYHKAQNSYLFKHFDLNVDALSHRDRDWLNSLDKLDCLLFAFEQRDLGNKRAQKIIENVVNWMQAGIHGRTVPARVAQYFELVVEANGEQ
jgi:5'-deoxynucleotidase YfbR-like HD superfamily hydrolase